jgi:hypothetical protein
MSNMNDPFSDLILDEEEQLLETALEKGDFEEAPDTEDTKKCLQKLPRVTISSTLLSP